MAEPRPVKILFVDDEPDVELMIRQAFRRKVRDGSYALEFAHNGVEALQRLDVVPDIDVVLTDINMPEMDGLTLLGRIHDLGRLVRTVIVSAYGDMQNIRTAMNRGAADFLTKPIDFEDMDITVQKTWRELEAMRRAEREHDQLVVLRREMDLASQLQQSILPRTFPPFPGRPELDLHATMLPARDVGGDFYDFFLVDESRLGLVIADVSGKGMTAALFMSMTRALLKSTALQGLAPEACLHHLNRVLCLDNAAEMFVTVFYGILDTRSGRFEYCNGGHNPPFLVRRGGTVEEVPVSGGMLLGMVEEATFGCRALSLEPGDGLLLYTDGVTEAMTADGIQFTEAALAGLLHPGHSAREVVESVVQAVQNHAAGAPQSDDITALFIRFRGR